jgi:hypothetical protein
MGTIAPNTASGADAISCPAGYIASGGGFISTTTTFTVMNNAPSLANPTTWLPEAYNTGTSAIDLEVRIVCLSAPHLHQQIVQQPLNNGGLIAVNDVSSTTFGCPGGSVIGGGGLDSGYPDLYEGASGPYDTAHWYEYLANYGPIAAIAQVDITCLKIG